MRLKVKGRKGGRRGHGKQVDEESVKIGLRREDALECWRKSDCCWMEVNLVTLICWEHYQILNNGVSLSEWSVVVYRLLLDGGEPGHPHLLGTLPDFKHQCVSLSCIG